MKEGLLEKIQNLGHWRVNIRPASPLSDRFSFQRCQELVEQSRVSLRGWDYPHISHRNDEQSGFGRVDDYFENWTDWRSQVEFWRQYRSGQFISYNALNDDTEFAVADGRRELNVIDAIYTVSEFTDFAGRLLTNAPFESGAIFTATLVGTAGRVLAAGRNRMPFLDPRTTGSERLEFPRRLSQNDDMQQVAIGILLEVFDSFGWNPAESQIRGDQEKFYRREYSV